MEGRKGGRGKGTMVACTCTLAKVHVSLLPTLVLAE